MQCLVVYVILSQAEMTTQTTDQVLLESSTISVQQTPVWSMIIPGRHSVFSTFTFFIHQVLQHYLFLSF